MVFTGGDVPKRAGAMPEHKAQVGLVLYGCGDLQGNILNYIEARGIGLSLIGDERSPQLEKYKFLHGSI
jgi:hypothetical protein